MGTKGGVYNPPQTVSYAAFRRPRTASSSLSELSVSGSAHVRGPPKRGTELGCGASFARVGLADTDDSKALIRDMRPTFEHRAIDAVLEEGRARAARS